MGDGLYIKEGCDLFLYKLVETKDDGRMVYEPVQQRKCDESNCSFEPIKKYNQLVIKKESDGSYSVEDFFHGVSVGNYKLDKLDSAVLVRRSAGFFGEAQGYLDYFMYNQKQCQDGEPRFGSVAIPPKGSSKILPPTIIRNGDYNLSFVTMQIGPSSSLSAMTWVRDKLSDVTKGAGAVVVYYPKSRAKEAEEMKQKYIQQGIYVKTVEVGDELYVFGGDAPAETPDKVATAERKRTITLAFIPTDGLSKELGFPSLSGTKEERMTLNEEWSGKIIEYVMSSSLDKYYEEYLVLNEFNDKKGDSFDFSDEVPDEVGTDS